MTKTNQLPSTKRITQAAVEKKAPVLSDDINAAIASKIIATTPAPEVAARIKTRLMQRVNNNNHLFVFAHQGQWKTVQEGVQIKLLHKVGKNKSYLIKMAKNASISGHLHAQDEESFVVNGSVTIEGILCHEGDYHYAQAGSQHQAIRTAQGCTLLVRSL